MRASILGLVISASVSLLVACGDDDEVAPPDTSVPPRPDTGPREDTGPRDAGRDLGRLDAGDAGEDVDAGPRPDLGPEFDGGPIEDSGPIATDAGCEGTGGCWSCPPTEPLHFLNRCTSSECAAFDNEARLPLYTGPTFPPLP